MKPATGSHRLGLSRLHFPIRSLGFGRRIGLWVQGCTLACRGCMSIDTWRPATTLSDVSSVLEAITPWLQEADGISITGGEPLQQAEALGALLSLVRPIFAGDIILFTGFPAEALPKGTDRVVDLIDVLVAGPFDSTRPGNRPLVGSDNQTLVFKTSLGADRYSLFSQQTAHRPVVDVIEDSSGLWIAGVPRAGDLERLSKALEEQKLSLKTSQGRWGKA